MSMFENIENALVELREDKHIMALETNALDWYKREKQRIAGNIETALQKDKEYHKQAAEERAEQVREYVASLVFSRDNAPTQTEREVFDVCIMRFKDIFELW